jgi:hypothetical protein
LCDHALCVGDGWEAVALGMDLAIHASSLSMQFRQFRQCMWYLPTLAKRLE